MNSPETQLSIDTNNVFANRLRRNIEPGFPYFLFDNRRRSLPLRVGLGHPPQIRYLHTLILAT